MNPPVPLEQDVEPGPHSQAARTGAGPRILGASLGDPGSAMTYAGMPYHCFAELRRLGVLVAAADSLICRRRDYLTGRLDIRWSLRDRRPHRSALWRFYPRSIAALSRRFQELERTLPEHDVVLQISGVGAMPLPHVPLAAHVEISVQTAASLPEFAGEYGFAGHSRRALARAVDGQRGFLERCDLVFTNSAWCADDLRAAGVPAGKIRVQPPAANTADPGPLERRWDRCSILFIGLHWQRKGGPQLLEAFRRVRSALPEATLSIVGSDPQVNEPGVRVFGRLRKDQPQQRETLEQLLRESTIFCMPSSWESTGLVYAEAALYGLPVVMLRGQGREAIFPPFMAVHLDDRRPETLAECLIGLARSPETMEQMGASGRRHVLANYTWPVVARRMLDEIGMLARRRTP